MTRCPLDSKRSGNTFCLRTRSLSLDSMLTDTQEAETATVEMTEVVETGTADVTIVKGWCHLLSSCQFC